MRSPAGNAVEMYLRQVLPGYFTANGLPLKAGREFRDEDVRSKASLIVINDETARVMFGGEPAVGRTFKMREAFHEVIGVVGNVRHNGPLSRIQAETYSLVDTSVAQPLTVVLRVGAQYDIPLDRIRQAALSVGPRVLFEGVQSGSELFKRRIIAPRHRAALFGMLGGLGLVLALLGIGTVTAHRVDSRPGRSNGRHSGHRQVLVRHHTDRSSHVRSGRDSLWLRSMACGVATCATRSKD